MQRFLRTLSKPGSLSKSIFHSPMTNYIFRNCILIFVISLFFTACEQNKIKLPKSDNTAPQNKWVLEIQKDKVETHEFFSDTSFNIGKDYKIHLLYVVSDSDGGVKRISVKGGGNKACPASNTYTDWGPANKISWYEDVILSPESDNSVTTKASRFGNFDFECQPYKNPGGSQLQVMSSPSGTATFIGKAENYYGGKCTISLTIVSDPK
jgi:hypothetical protein